MPSPKPRSSIHQRQRKKAGDAGEKHVEGLNEHCRLRGIATLRKSPTPLKILKRVGKFLWCVPEKKAIADYVGTMAGGRSVSVEVKSVSDIGKSFSLAEVKPHQVEYLNAELRAGAVVVLLIVHAGGLVSYAVPWDVVVTSGKRIFDHEWLAIWKIGSKPYLERFAER